MKIVLKDLLSLYVEQLCDRVFVLTLSDNRTIRIQFFREQLCHLLGIQHVFVNDKRYKGESGYKKIDNEELKVEDLKSHNKEGYAKIKERLSHFDEILDLIHNGSLLRFYQDRVRPPTKLQAELCIYNEKQSYIIHLFLKHEKENLYAPTSFIIKTCNDDNYRQFVTGQEYKKIKERDIILMKNNQN